MGDPKRHKKKYSAPAHPWQKARIEEEKELLKEYGFKNKNEIWKMVSFLRAAAAQAKKLVTLSGPQAEKEKELLLSRLKRYGLLSPEAGLADILSISLRDVLERRLQTQVYKKNLANSVNQSRQFITHEHVCIGGRVITSPSYLVSISEESQISFRHSSHLSDTEHPERIAARKVKEKESKEKVLDKEEDKKDKKDKKPTRKARPARKERPAGKGKPKPRSKK
ncbi:30S ribosomal protein S4 [Candidatus Woesearchaeota archaeon]|nr:30S ribosomal protein S4 [Candidatus Woesearchaeota archaeon]